jgi:hypothetical protein
MGDWMRDMLDAGARKQIAERDAILEEIDRQGRFWAAGEIQTLRQQLKAARTLLDKQAGKAAEATA